VRTLVRLLAVSTLVGAMVLAGAGTASAEPTGALASYRGGTIDLSKGWGDAMACVVFSRLDVRCFDTYEEADAAAAVKGAEAPTARVKSDCGASWLCLWRAANFTDRRLQFRDGNWQDLEPYGFRNEMTSWFNNQDCAWFNDKTDYGYVQDVDGMAYATLTLSPCAASSNVGVNWNDRADWVQG
jgi:hypothetical protein